MRDLSTAQCLANQRCAYTVLPEAESRQLMIDTPQAIFLTQVKHADCVLDGGG